MKNSRIMINIPIIVVMVLTLLLLSYVGYGETKRIYPRFQLRKLVAQGEIIQISLDSYLRAGLPLAQFSGFNSSSDGILLSDAGIELIRIKDMKDRVLFENMQKNISSRQIHEQAAARHYKPLSILPEYKAYDIEESEQSYRVTIPLKSKFGPVGHVLIEENKSHVFQTLNQKYRNVFYTALILSLGFVIFVFCFVMFSRNKNRRGTVLKTAFTLCFFLMSAVIAVSVFHIYEYGARFTTKAMSDSMARRLSAVAELGIDFRDIEGVSRVFQHYRDFNPDIQAIALTKEGKVIFHTDENMIGRPYMQTENCYEYAVDLLEGKKGKFRVAVTIPTDVVMRVVMGSARNFIVLFIACGLISLIFLDAGTGLLLLDREPEGKRLINSPGDRAAKEADVSDESFRIGLSLVKPAYFLIVFVNALCVSFLPQLVSRMAESAGTSLATASLPFSIYYAVFAAVLIPAGHYAERGNLKVLMAVGFLAEVIGLLLVALTANYWLLTLGRIFSGIGQGVFLIGLQSYLLAITPADKRTQGAAVKVIGRNAGLISGAAIGALLYAYTDYRTLFMLGSALSLVGMFYLWTLVPGTDSVTGIRTVVNKEKKHIFRNLVHVFRDGEFMKTLVLVGLVGKMGITGVVMFSIPLVLEKQLFAPEDIGQALMIYYISSMLMTHYASRVVDRLGASRLVLFLSALIGGIGMLVLGFIGVTQLITDTAFPGLSWLNNLGFHFNHTVLALGGKSLCNAIILFCLILAGISNGLLAAPVLTHINKCDVAENVGNKSLTATYIFLERVGHVFGPMFVSWLFVFSDQSNIAISLFGIITLLTGLMFMLTSQKA